MRTILLFATLAMAATAAVAKDIVRQQWQDTVYVLRGKSADLSEFHEKFGRPWTGGKVIDSDPSDGSISYWAFPERTASQSRALMMPAIFSGLELRIEDYNESRHSGLERRQLDTIVRLCSVGTDLFFITPLRTLEIRPTAATTETQIACLKGYAQKHIKLAFEPARQAAADD